METEHAATSPSLGLIVVILGASGWQRCALRSYTTDARNDILGCFGRSDRSALRQICLTTSHGLGRHSTPSPTVVRPIAYTNGSSQYTMSGSDKPNSQGKHITRAVRTLLALSRTVTS
jgi:hypothetical protein